MNKLFLRILIAKLSLFKGTIALWVVDDEDLENSLLFDIDTMINKCIYMLEV